MYYIVRFCGKLTFFLNCLYFNFFWRPKFFNFFLTFPNKFLTFGLTFQNSEKKLEVQNFQRHYSVTHGHSRASNRRYSRNQKKTRCFHVFACKMLKCRYDFFRKILKMIDFHRENQQSVKLFLHTP